MRSILNPVSLVELSVQERLICVDEATVPVKFDGVTGNAVVVLFPFSSELVEQEQKIANTVIIKNIFSFCFYFKLKFNKYNQ